MESVIDTDRRNFRILLATVIHIVDNSKGRSQLLHK